MQSSSQCFQLQKVSGAIRMRSGHVVCNCSPWGCVGYPRPYKQGLNNFKRQKNKIYAQNFWSAHTFWSLTSYWKILFKAISRSTHLKEQCHGWACALVCTRFGELFEPSAILNFALGMIQGKFTPKYALEQPLFCTFWFSFCLVWKILHCSCVFFASMDSEVGEDSIVSFELLWSWQIWSWLVSCLLLI